MSSNQRPEYDFCRLRAWSVSNWSLPLVTGCLPGEPPEYHKFMASTGQVITRWWWQLTDLFISEASMVHCTFSVSIHGTWMDQMSPTTTKQHLLRHTTGPNLSSPNANGLSNIQLLYIMLYQFRVCVYASYIILYIIWCGKKLDIISRDSTVQLKPPVAKWTTLYTGRSHTGARQLHVWTRGNCRHGNWKWFDSRRLGMSVKTGIFKTRHVEKSSKQLQYPVILSRHVQTQFFVRLSHLLGRLPRP